MYKSALQVVEGSLTGQIQTQEFTAMRSASHLFASFWGPDFEIQTEYRTYSRNNPSEKDRDFAGYQSGLGDKATCLELTAMYPNHRVPPQATDSFTWVT